MPDIFDEIAEDLRTERALRLAKRYGGLLVLALILVLVGVGVRAYYASYRGHQAEQAATRYLALTKDVDNNATPPAPADAAKAAQALSDFAATAPQGYKTLADLRAAALYMQAGHRAKAADLWNAVGRDGNADPLLRDLANLLWAQHELGHAPDSQVLARLSPLAKADDPFNALARETQAMAYLRQGNQDMAKSLLSALSNDPNAPQSVRTRAGGLLAQLKG